MSTSNNPTVPHKPKRRLLRWLAIISIIVGTIASVTTTLAAFTTILPFHLFSDDPNISGTWNGSLTELTHSSAFPLGVTGVTQIIFRQAGSQLTGSLTVQSPLPAGNDGTLAGSIDANGQVHFDVTNDAHSQVLQFSGEYSQTTGSMSGTYTTPHGFSGTWIVTQSSTSSRTTVSATNMADTATSDIGQERALFLLGMSFLALFLILMGICLYLANSSKE